jgi:hypothetical protein
MANKTKAKKKAKKPKKAVSKKAAPKKPAKKKAAFKKPAPKKSTKKLAVKGRTTSGKRTIKRASRTKAEVTLDVSPDARNLGVQTDSGDLQGLSDIASADSESVDELLDEGNAFEAAAVKGVQDADGADEHEVHTHEVPEDDVPEEYLDKE